MHVTFLTPLQNKKHAYAKYSKVFQFMCNLGNMLNEAPFDGSYVPDEGKGKSKEPAEGEDEGYTGKVRE